MDKFTDLFVMGFVNSALNMSLMKKFQNKLDEISNYIIEGQYNQKE